MSTVSVQLPDNLHEEARKLAESKHITIDELFANALTHLLSARAQEEYFVSRTRGASKEKFLRVMAKVPAVEPEEHDRL